MRIFELCRGDRRRIVGLPADAGRRRYYESLGLFRDATVEVIFAARYGLAVRTAGVRLALSRDAALEVEVSSHDAAFAVRQSQFGQEHAV